MIIGVGTDILDIERMRKNIDDSAFMRKVFTQAEAHYIASRGNMKAASAAGIFSAKESIMKATGEGMRIPLQNMEIIHDERGKPLALFRGQTAEHYAGYVIHVSISHTDSVAVAFAVIENIGGRV